MHYIRSYVYKDIPNDLIVEVHLLLDLIAVRDGFCFIGRSQRAAYLAGH
jgi:hypothetical protein